MDKELKNKDLEEVSGGSTKFEPKLQPIIRPGEIIRRRTVPSRTEEYTGRPDKNHD